jgi:hypothetical protein
MKTAWPEIGGIQVDVDALCGIAHACNPDCCTSQVNCCACFDVAITESEASRIVNWLPEAARFAPRLREGDSFILPFEKSDEAGYSLEVNEADVCVLAYRRPSGATLCSLHSAALAHGVPPSEVKPRSCMLWPLALTSSKPYILTVQEGAFAFGCNRPREGVRTDLDKGVAAIIKNNFGEKFLQQVLALL